MLHNLPATVSVMDALNAYCEGKIRMLRDDDTPSAEEKKDDDHDAIEDTKKNNEASLSSSSTIMDDTSNNNQEEGEEGNHHHHAQAQVTNPAEQEWRDMTCGLAMYFDKALPKQLLYRHEIPQCLVLDGNDSGKRYCELYSCEFLLRLCIKLPELVAIANDISEEEKPKIIFKVMDLVRFLQKNQNIYLLQRYRKPTIEESQKARKLRMKLGLGQYSVGVDGGKGGSGDGKSGEKDRNETVVLESENDVENKIECNENEFVDVKRKKKGGGGGPRKKKKMFV
mmetsp:Transcript_4370/g.5031  ORF Transcript_4370/g.5031 Transcript_4370/m.5031 type:complete len:282 (+) Transcript_4370:1001-1846(+)